MTIREIADDLNRNKWYVKNDGSEITPYQIHRRTKNYPQYFNSEGSAVWLVGHSVRKSEQLGSGLTGIGVQNSDGKDEKYVIDLCDLILGLTSSRQHKFEFLLGDKNTKGLQAKLPVDCFYHKLGLVIEYREKQHSEGVSFFDKTGKVTVSGVDRGQQRRIYDDRRRTCLPANGIELIEISYFDLVHDSQKRLKRDKERDEGVLRKILRKYIKRD